MHRDMVEWRGQNPPPATMMIISDEVQGVFDWDLPRLQQRTLYYLFLAYSVEPNVCIILSTSEKWCWKRLLYSKTSGLHAVQCAKLYCNSCNFDCQNLNKFNKHLSSYKHLRQVSILSLSLSLSIWDFFWSNYYHTPLAGGCKPYLRRSPMCNGELGNELQGYSWIRHS